MTGSRTAFILIATTLVVWAACIVGSGRVGAPATVTAFGLPPHAVYRYRSRGKTWPSSSSWCRTELIRMGSSTDDNADDDDDDDAPPLPGQMKISEIKSELDLRKVSYSDCFDRESLECRLNDARASGKADPSIIDEFNKRNLEATFEGKKNPLEVSEDMIANSLGGDGTLPGGMPPEMLKAMMGDEELVAMLRSPKMQEIVSV